MASPAMTSVAGTKALPPSAAAISSRSSRRRKGPAFLPSEHDDLPPGVAFMVSDSKEDMADDLDSYGTHRAHHRSGLE